MPRSRHNLALVAGLLCLASGTLGAGLAYRSMRTENLTHARTGEVRLDPGAPPRARFQPYRAGVYTVFLAPDPSCPEEARARSGADALRISVSPPGLPPAFERTVPPGTALPEPHPENGWIPLGEVEIADPGEQAWTLEAERSAGDAGGAREGGEREDGEREDGEREDGESAADCLWSVFLLPPQSVEIGSFLRSRIYLLLGCGALMAGGFVLIVAGGRRRT